MSTRNSNFLNVLSYVAVVSCGLALALSFLLGKMDVSTNLIGALRTIAHALAYIVVSCYSFRFARARGTVWLVFWVIAVVLIVVFLIF